MIRDDDFDCLGIEIAGERLVVWTDGGDTGGGTSARAERCG
jgi:hypothetical protein